MYKILWNVLKTVFAGGDEKHWESIRFEDSEFWVSSYNNIMFFLYFDNMMH